MRMPGFTAGQSLRSSPHPIKEASPCCTDTPDGRWHCCCTETVECIPIFNRVYCYTVCQYPCSCFGNVTVVSPPPTIQ
jgi:hypothetical protein